MTVTIPLVVIAAIAVWICHRYLGLKFWHALVCVLLGFLLAATSAAPDIHAVLTWLAIRWGHRS